MGKLVHFLLVGVAVLAVAALIIGSVALAKTREDDKEDFMDSDNHKRCTTDSTGKNGAVASFHPLATDAGIEILKLGGNAYDAAAAVQFALTVVEPQMSGIGGGCFILFRNASGVYTLDGREEATNAMNATYFCKDPSDPMCTTGPVTPDIEMKTGGLPVGVPGTLAAIKRMLDEHGTMTLTQVMRPAIKIAEEGFAVNLPLFNDISYNKDRLARYNDSAKLYLQSDGSPKPVGTVIKNPDLAQTFKDIAQNGIEFFYSGQLAQEIVDTVRNSVNPTTGRAGIMELADLQGYKAVYRAPTKISYKGKYNVYGMPSPSSGGLTMALMLNIFEGIDFTNIHAYSTEHVSKMADVSNLAFADRNEWMGDADFVDVPTSGLQNKPYARTRRALMNPYNALQTPILAGVPPGAPSVKPTKRETPPEHGTTHFLTSDKWGNIVSCTSTIELAFGAAVTVPGRGFLLNNELSDFNYVGQLANGVYVANGPEGGKKLRRTALGDESTLGGKRPRSSMCPTIVTDANDIPIFAAGAPGGSTIIGHVMNSFHKWADYNMCLNETMSPPYVIARNSPMLLAPGSQFWPQGYIELIAGLTARGFATPVPDVESSSHTLALLHSNGTYTVAPNAYYRASSLKAF